jgi:hypothetical protein
MSYSDKMDLCRVIPTGIEQTTGMELTKIPHEENMSSITIPVDLKDSVHAWIIGTHDDQQC